MLRRFGWFYYIIGFRRSFERIRVEDHSVEKIRLAAARGPMVYALPVPSTVDHLALNSVLVRRRLPLSVWADRVRSFYWQPLAEAWSDVAWRFRSWTRRGRAPDPITSGWLEETVYSGLPVTIFQSHEDISRQDSSDGHEGEGVFTALLAAQDRSERPISIVPTIVVWDRAPQRERHALHEFFQVGRPVTGFIAGLRNAWLRSAGAFIQVAEPIDLSELVRRVPPERRVRALRMLIALAIRRESVVIRGPHLVPYRQLRRAVLQSPPIRELARSEAAALGKREEDIQRQMAQDYDRIAARFSFTIIRILALVLRPLWTRVFSGVDVGDEDLERIRAAIRGGSAILVPCHKSHLDYVLLSWVFFRHDLIVPHVVAGTNLAIWPLSLVLRGAGAFFVKRRFSGERIFPAVFGRYLRELMFRGYPVEFFIEGGRTRSGKLLPPRLGVLGMVLDATEQRPSDHRVTLLPIALAYEQVAEEGVYARELGGETKSPESMGQLVRARSVLRHRFGRVYLRVGEPVDCAPYVDASKDGTATWSERSRGEKQMVLQQLGERVIHHIGQVMVLLPTSLVALALLAHHRRGMKHGELLARIDRFHNLLRRANAPEAASMARRDQAITEALDRFLRNRLIESLEHDGERVWAIHPDRRITLEFYKNQVIHYLAEAGLVCLTIRALPPGPINELALRSTFVSTLWTFRREFVLDPSRSTTDLLGHGLETLVEHGAIKRRDDERYEVTDTSRMGEIYGLFRNFPESYMAVLQGIERLNTQTMNLGELVAAIQSDGPALLASGAVTRPESMSIVPIKNAIRAFEEEGVLTRDQRSGFQLNRAAKRQRARSLAAMVD